MPKSIYSILAASKSFHAASTLNSHLTKRAAAVVIRSNASLRSSSLDTEFDGLPDLFLLHDFTAPKFTNESNLVVGLMC